MTLTDVGGKGVAGANPLAAGRSGQPVGWPRTCGTIAGSRRKEASLLALFVLFVVVIIVVVLSAPGARFLPGFAELLTTPTIRRGAIAWLTGKVSASGRFRDREVEIRLQLKRSRHGQGYLVIAMRATSPSLTYTEIEERARDDSGRRALFSLARHDLLLSVDQGWLKASWQPQGFVFFPGRFSPEKWREVLEEMYVLATSIERPV